MGNFNRGGGFGDKKSSGGFGRRDGGRDGGRGFGGGRDGGRPEMHQATCAECGATCEVPFKPTGDRPVYCSNCFKGKEASGPSRFGDRGNDRGERREFSKPNFSDNRGGSNGGGISKEHIEALHAKLDKILRTLEHLSSLGKDFGQEAFKDATQEAKKLEKRVVFEAKDLEKKAAAKVTAKVTEVRAAVAKAVAPKAAAVSKAIAPKMKAVKKVIKKAKKK